MRSVSYSGRIQRLAAKRDEFLTRLAHQEPDGRVARFLRMKITNLECAMGSLHRLDVRSAILHERRIQEAQAAAARAATQPLPALGVTTPGRGSFSSHSAPLPMSAQDYHPARDSELECVTVWTPHRDAPSLIGSYKSRPRG